jgi:formylglycine-generating enzyme required for sulfatase activity
MRARNIVGPLALVAATLMASSAFAITPITNFQQMIRNQIAQQLAPQKSYALVIGISEFDNPGWPDLQGVPTEVAGIRDALIAQHFQIVPESGDGRIDHQTLTDKITRFFDTYGRDADNRLVVYIATHGYADKNNPSPDGYLIASDAGVPHDGRVDNGFSVNQLDVTLRDLAAQHVFFFFNSCFSAAMLPEPTRALVEDQVPRRIGDTLSRETADWTLDLLAHNARLVLTAGSASQTVPDVDNPFAKAVVDALDGEADMDGDGLILGTEIAQFVRGRVARATRLAGHANDPVFAVVPKRVSPPIARPDAPPSVDYALQGDFVFLAPDGPKQTAQGESEQQAMLEDKREQLTSNQFLACVDCPTMVEVPGTEAHYALSSTEITYAQWDACFRESICRRYIPDDGLGRGDRPVGGVTWLDALQYTTWLSTKADGNEPCDEYRLPTTQEWQSAALYSTHGTVTWETAVADTSPICWGCSAGQDGNAAVRTASSPANPAGLYDMVGNLWEWVDSDEGACTPEAVDNKSCAPGLVMGGSYATRVDALPAIADGGAAPRTGNAQPWSSPTIGFRVACEVKAVS